MGAILWGLFLCRQGGEPMPRKPKQSDESLQELSQQNTPWDWWQFKSNVRETWRVILVSEADIFLSESLRILAERLSQSETHLPLRQICYYSPPKEVGVFSTEIKAALMNKDCLSVNRADSYFSVLWADPAWRRLHSEYIPCRMHHPVCSR